jgi:urate oxidase
MADDDTLSGLEATENDGSANRTMNYGKEHVAVCRTFATPLTGVREIPESEFDGRDNTLLGMEVRVQVEGEAFLPSFSGGDNSMVVATDTMKNFVHHQLGEYDRATMEGFLHFVGERFLETYSQMETVQVSADELSVEPKRVPGEDGFEPSDLVFGISDGPSGYGEFTLSRGDDGATIEDQRSGVSGIEMIKVKDNSFTGFVQDEYTTLPERENRTLYVTMDIFWTYDDEEAALGEDPERYVPAEQVRDIAATVFDEYDVNSIQDLIYRIGRRTLKRFPQLETVSFEANNRTWLKVRDDLEGDAKVLREPPRPTGFQQFSMDRDDLDGEESE